MVRVGEVPTAYQLRVDVALAHALLEFGRLELLPVRGGGGIPRNVRREDFIVEEVEAGSHTGLVNEERCELSSGFLLVRVTVRGGRAMADK